ncbi:hypothetical protein L6164_006540 [Bauhinia variegata]|uniref:Uncharacterized protein n=1 Tax=Bauhinia variegata TaxID=167791 RepID=A0ACB9PUS7_BAUVA|nr:hypothetical protein L6164_006540 [Bauhinia variegata]
MKTILFTFLLMLSILFLSSSTSARTRLTRNGGKLQVSPPSFTSPTRDPKHPVPIRIPPSCNTYKRQYLLEKEFHYLRTVIATTLDPCQKKVFIVFHSSSTTSTRVSKQMEIGLC